MTATLNRRGFLNLAATSAAVGLASTAARAATGGIGAVAFDAFVIFDPRPVAALAEQLFPGKAADLMATWRTRQFEYAWQRTLTRSYADFRGVTTDALVFAGAAHGIALSADARDRLLAAYLHLPAWPDVLPALQALKAAKIRMALLSNFTAQMLAANVAGEGIGEYFEAQLSTDAVRAFKPDPRAYAMGAKHFGLPREKILFAAFGGWDAVGARRFGYPVYWCNRLAQPAEELGVVADHSAQHLAELPSFIRG